MKSPAQWGALVALAILVPAQLMVLYRVFRGPSAADRVVSADCFGILALGVIAGLTVLDREAFLLPSALVIAILSFLSTVGFAYYLSQKGGK